MVSHFGHPMYEEQMLVLTSISVCRNVENRRALQLVPAPRGGCADPAVIGAGRAIGNDYAADAKGV
jgi:hypothetical protein